LNPLAIESSKIWIENLSFLKLLLLAVVQGAAELLPISSSAHVIVAEKAMGLDPSTPMMTFLLVMLHTGTMVAVLFYFWPRWRQRLQENAHVNFSFRACLQQEFVRMAAVATIVTGGVGLMLKKLIETVVLPIVFGESQGEVEHLFKSLPLMAISLFMVGTLIWFAGRAQGSRIQKPERLSLRTAIHLGWVQGLCLPFRGFSRSGATISVALLSGLPQALAEDFSFALAVLLTPAVFLLEFHRLWKAIGVQSGSQIEQMQALFPMVLPGLVGAGLSFLTGCVALRILSAGLERRKWSWFGMYCWAASMGVYALSVYWGS
jgi:undecaprenyl-diphosphatase